MFAVALALMAGRALADTPPIVNTDFTLTDPNRLPTNWEFNVSLPTAPSGWK